MARHISPNENHLKAQILNELRRRGRISSATVLINELPLGATGVRADMALISRHVTGVEIKSERDSLKRLARQLLVYRSYFNKTILVLGSKHWQEASSMDLSGIEIWIASGLALRKVQSGFTSDRTLAQEELVPTTLKTKYPSETTRPSDDLFKSVLIDRFSATSRAFWSSVNGRRIESSDLALLSRFLDKKEKSALIGEAVRKERKAWLDALAQSVHSSSVSKNDLSSK